MINCEFENDNKASLRHVTTGCLVLKDDEILLVKRTAKLLEAGKWCLPGGFVGRDETIKQAIKREVLEETGYTIEEPTLLKINDNPDRPGEDRQNIDFVYFAKAGEKVGEADSESDDVKWFNIDGLPKKEEIAFDHNANIQLYLKFLKSKFTLPVTN